MPEGDTIAYAANRIRPVLEGRVPDEILTPQPRHALDGWPERLSGRTLTGVDTHGKHLFLRFEGDLVLHSHLGMVGVWGVYANGRRWGRSPRRAWIVFRVQGHEVVEFDGPLLELMTDSRTRFDQRLVALGPDVLAEKFDRERFLKRLRSDDQTRHLGDALLDQRNVAGIGNIWKAEGCWEAHVDPWRRVRDVTDDEAAAIIEKMRPRMQRSATFGHRTIQARVYGHAGRPCPRCGTAIAARGQGDANRTTYWCPGCQT
ncbi:MAG TPA: DNA-formamidopyrimidine glycosylase family protein [Solirubrobacteraceae bacterium]|nr:DNA-formamidopyrimidine glycosylase family protein [Solirubrobacteraceae bacterium]